MPFETMTAAQYRSLDADAFEQRRAAVLTELENADSQVSTADLTSEVNIIEQEVERRNAAVNLRNQRVQAVANGAGALMTGGAQVRTSTDARVVRDEDPFDSDEYTRAFARSLMYGEPIPADVRPENRPQYVREDAFTYTTDVANFIPTTLARQIIEKMSVYGEIWPEVTKLNVQGGLDINVWDFLPTASWITESTQADYQKATNPTRISFKYYMAEVRVAQSFLTNLVTLDQFRTQFPAKCAEAMVRLLEQGIMRGTGSGQMLGILNETRIASDHKVTVAATDMPKFATWATMLSPLPRAYRNGTYIMAQNTWDKYINGMVDSQGQPIARVNYGMEGANFESYRFMGRPVKIVEDDILPSYDDANADESATPFMIYTRLSDYLVNQQEGMRTVRWFDEEANLIKDKVQTVVDGKMGDVYGTMVFSAPGTPGE